jgi:hypothetical protein
MKVNELNTIIENTVSKEIKKIILKEMSENKKEVYHIKCEGEPIATFDNEDDAKEELPKYKKSHPGKELIIEKGIYESHEDMLDKLDEMGEELEENENQNMKNQEPMEGNAFSQELLKAKEAGHDKFTVDGKEYNVEECWKQLEEEESIGEEEDCYECGDMNEEDNDDDSFGEDYENLPDGDQPIEEKNDYDVDSEFEVSNDNDRPKGYEKIKKGDKLKITKKWRNASDNVYGTDKGEDGRGLYASDIDDLTKSMNEEGTCNECGGSLNEEGVCNECSGLMWESKKKRIKITESNLVKLINKMVNEAMKGEPGTPGIAGMTVTKSVQSMSKKENDDAMSNVAKKMKDYLSFDGNDNPEFPQQIGEKTKKEARINTPQQDDEVAKNFAGLQNLEYDVEPSDKFKKRLKMAIEGDATMGNGSTTVKASIKPSNGAEKGKEAEQKSGNNIKTDTDKKIEKQVKGREEDKEKRVLYPKEKVPVKTISESKVTFSNVLLEEIEKMKKLTGYNKKTQ